MTQKQIINQFVELKKQLQQIGMPIPGSIHESYRKCGKTNCRCQISDKYRHGPYYVWYRKLNGKLTTQSIQKKNVQMYKEWINNRKKIEKILEAMLTVCAQYPIAIKRGNLNSKKMDS